jgi:hypothetical protein
MAAALTAWKEAATASRRLVLMAGEPGIGKTRLAAEVARQAHDEGALVLYGRCDDELGVPFQPFVEALDWYLECADAVALGGFPGDLARLSPRVMVRCGAVPAALQADPDTEQFRLFDAVAAWLAEVAAEQPVVMVLDDLHWATKPTLVLLRHVMRRLDAARVLILGTYRDTDLDRAHPLASMLGEFRKLDGVSRLALAGLAENEVLELLERISDQDADEQTKELATALVSETEGNPFFIGEVIRHLVESDAIVRRDGRWTSDLTVTEMGIPEGIKEVLGQRLDSLGPNTTDYLRAAAVVGRAFDLATVVAATASDDESTISAIEPALTAGLVEETGPDHYRFAHALVRSALVGELSTSRRLRLHRRIAEHLDARAGEPGTVAFHWLEAASSADPTRTVAAVCAASEHAIARGAYDDAVALLARVVAFADEMALEDADRRELALRLGETRMLAGHPDATATLQAVIDDAAFGGDTPRLVRATLATSRFFSGNVGYVDEAAVARHLLALDALGEQPTRERALLLASLAGELCFELTERRITYINEATRIARGLEDSNALAFVYISHTVVTCPDPRQQDHAARELDDLLSTALARAERVMATVARHVFAVYQGDIAGAREALTALRSAVADAPIALGRWLSRLYEAKMHRFDGRLGAAERCNDEALAIGLESGFSDAATIWMSIDIGISRDLGRTLERIDFYRENINAVGGTPEGSAVASVMDSVYAVLHADAHVLDHAGRELNRELIAELPLARARNTTWLVCSAYLADAAVALRHVDAARTLYDLILPYESRIVAHSTTLDGYADRVLGRLATILGEFDRASAHLSAARRLHEQARAPLFLARTLADQAALEIASVGDTARSQELVGQAVEIARARRAPGVEHYALRALEAPSS